MDLKDLLQHCIGFVVADDEIRALLLLLVGHTIGIAPPMLIEAIATTTRSVAAAAFSMRASSSSRVTSRCSHAGSRICTKPSMTIWPASVAVSVDAWPDASSASAKSVLANVTPSSGESSL